MNNRERKLYGRMETVNRQKGIAAGENSKLLVTGT